MIVDLDWVCVVDWIVLFGVGVFVDCKCGLWVVDGMFEVFEEVVYIVGKLFFGICVGM